MTDSIHYGLTVPLPRSDAFATAHGAFRTESEVMAALRQHGLDSIEGVGAVVLETDGSFSVIRTIGPSSSALNDVS